MYFNVKLRYMQKTKNTSKSNHFQCGLWLRLFFQPVCRH